MAFNKENSLNKSLPKIILVGSINSGKSTLFNRLLGSQKAVTSKIPGTTRDWISQITSFSGKPALLIDTAGFLEKKGSNLEKKIKDFWLHTIKKADVFILVVDSKIGPTPQDNFILNYLRKFEKPIILAINKVDNMKLAEEKIRIFSELATNQVICVSSLLNKNIENLKKKIGFYLKKEKKKITFPQTKIALIGRPNVGKSTLLNSLIEEKRSIIDEESGTTRDEIEAFLFQDAILIDTPGLKRKSKIQDILGFFSSRRSIYSIKNSDLIILILDAQEGPVHQEIKLASVCQKNKKPIIVVINKIDLIDKEKLKEIKYMVKKRFYFLGEFPIFAVSGLTKKNLNQLRHYLKLNLKSV